MWLLLPSWYIRETRPSKYSFYKFTTQNLIQFLNCTLSALHTYRTKSSFLCTNHIHCMLSRLLVLSEQLVLLRTFTSSHRIHERSQHINYHFSQLNHTHRDTLYLQKNKKKPPNLLNSWFRAFLQSFQISSLF